MIRGVREFGVNRVAKAVNDWQHEWDYARTEVFGSYKQVVTLHVTVDAVAIQLADRLHTSG
jgi:hypothetical protein